MAWSAPLTAVANVVLTAAQWNATVRDNLAETGPAKATAGGRLICASGVNTVAERDVVTASVLTAQSTATISYTDLATAGPAVTLTTGSKALVSVGCLYSNSGAASGGFMSHAISGATTAAADDRWAFVATSSQANDAHGGSHVALWTTLTPGSATFTAKYKNSAGTSTWSQRRIIVMGI